MFRTMRRFKQQISEKECIRILQEEKRGILSMHGEDGYPYGIPITTGSSNQRSASIAVKYSLLMAPDRNIVTKKIILNAVWPGNEKTDRIVMPEKGKQSRTADVLPEMNHRQ